MPLAAHCLAPRRMALGIKQSPRPPACRTRALAGIMLCKTTVKIDRPSDIGAAVVLATAPEDIDKASQRAVSGCANRYFIAFSRGQGVHAIDRRVETVQKSGLLAFGT